MAKGAVIELAVNYFPSHLRSRAEAQLMGAWMNGKQYEFSEDLEEDDRGFGRAYAPNKREITDEYENLRGLSPNNFAGLIVRTYGQLTKIEGISRPGESGMLKAWETFRRNRWLTTSNAIHEGALGQSVAYGVVLPGTDPLTGSAMSKMRGKSATRMSAFYDDDDDEWPTFAIEATRRKDEGEAAISSDGFTGWNVWIWDAYVIHRLTCKGNGLAKEDWEYIDFVEHNMPVPPVARCTNRLDLDGRSTGVIEPVLPLLRRIDQDTFDRLINQRFGAWQVRYIAGMAKPPTSQAAEAEKLRLSVADILVSTNAETKFGTLPAGELSPQIEVTDADLRILSAITQLAPHHLLGLSSNLQAEALAAATEGMQRQAFDFRGYAGEFHEQMARLVSMAEGDMVTAAAWDLRVRWKNTESGSMAQAAQALGMLATQLGVPIEMLWEQIPNWTDDDVKRAKELAESGELEKILAALAEQTKPQPEPTEQPKPDGDAD
jgi:hypothetical protein